MEEMELSVESQRSKRFLDLFCCPCFFVSRDAELLGRVKRKLKKRHSLQIHSLFALFLDLGYPPRRIK